MTRGSRSVDTVARSVRVVLGALTALAAVLVLAAPVAAQPGAAAGLGQQAEPSRPGGIGERPGGGGPTTERDEPGTTEDAPTTTEAKEPRPTTTATTEAGGDRETGKPIGRDDGGDDDDDDGTSIAALAGVGLGGLVLGVILAAVPLGAALARRKRPVPAASPYAPGSPGAVAPPPAPVAPAPTSGPVVGLAPSRDEAQARSQRAQLAEALMGLRDQLPSAALADEVARALASVGIVEVRPDGQPFDPARHRAVDQVATDDPARHNTVVSTERPGYADGDRVVRLPEVVVARHEATSS